jgi:hypothetical protein
MESLRDHCPASERVLTPQSPSDERRPLDNFAQLVFVMLNVEINHEL